MLIHEAWEHSVIDCAYRVHRNELGKIQAFWYWEIGKHPHDGKGGEISLVEAQEKADWKPCGNKINYEAMPDGSWRRKQTKEALPKYVPKLKDRIWIYRGAFKSLATVIEIRPVGENLYPNFRCKFDIPLGDEEQDKYDEQTWRTPWEVSQAEDDHE